MRLAYGYAQYGYTQWRYLIFTANVSAGEPGAVNASICAALPDKVRNRPVDVLLRSAAGRREPAPGRDGSAQGRPPGRAAGGRRHPGDLPP